jgi:U3 small nucleolar RNA-associated protein 4
MARQSGSAAHAISTGAVLNNDDVEMAGDSQLSSLQWKAGLRMTVENRGRRSATKIWALSVLKDGTVVSGDSMGNVQFWDGNAGTLMQTFEHNSNNGDVLDLALSHDQNKLMASGVDSRVICIERVSSTSCAESKWVLTNQQRSHTHDVTSLAMVYQSDSSGSLGPQQKCRELLCSGGVDTKVSSYFVSNMKKYRAKLAYKYPTKAPIALSKVPRILSIMRPDKVDFFQLAQIKTSVEKTSNMALNEEEAYLGSVGITSNHNLVAFDVSDDGKFLAVSHAAGLLLFALNLVEGVSEEDGASSTVLVPKKLNVPTDADVACSALKFGSDFLICATTNGPINLIRLNTETDDTSAMLEHTLNIRGNNAWLNIVNYDDSASISRIKGGTQNMNEASVRAICKAAKIEFDDFFAPPRELGKKLKLSPHVIEMIMDRHVCDKNKETTVLPEDRRLAGRISGRYMMVYLGRDTYDPDKLYGTVEVFKWILVCVFF